MTAEHRTAQPAGLPGRQRVEDALRSAALAVSAVEGEGLFGELVQSLAQILGVDIAFIALPSPTDASKLRMLAFCVDGRLIENFEYGLAGTPCESVLGQRYRIFPSRLTEQFPLDADFRNLGVDAYAGFPLTGPLGRPLGLIAVVSRRPLVDTELVEAMLKIFATRAVTEIERRHANEALHASEAQYRAIFNASADALVLWDSQYRRVDVNSAYERLYGWSRDEVIGRGYEHPAFTPEYARPRLELVRRALAGETCHAEFEAIRRTASASRPKFGRYRSSTAASRTYSPSRATSPIASWPRRRCAPARHSTARSSTRLPTRWSSAMRTSASSTSTRPMRRGRATPAIWPSDRIAYWPTRQA